VRWSERRSSFGFIEAVLYVSSSVRDTDFTAKLVGVAPNMRALLLNDGLLGARFREGLSKKTWMSPEGVYEVRIDLHATSNEYTKGHSNRLEVSSSNSPRNERTLNTGGNNFDESEGVVARNTVHRSARYPSHLLLPVVPGNPEP